jgi:hypothetical protein
MHLMCLLELSSPGRRNGRWPSPPFLCTLGLSPSNQEPIRTCLECSPRRSGSWPWPFSRGAPQSPVFLRLPTSPVVPSAGVSSVKGLVCPQAPFQVSHETLLRCAHRWLVVRATCLSTVAFFSTHQHLDIPSPFATFASPASILLAIDHTWSFTS